MEEEIKRINEHGLLREFRYLESAQMPRVGCEMSTRIGFDKILSQE